MASSMTVSFVAPVAAVVAVDDDGNDDDDDGDVDVGGSSW